MSYYLGKHMPMVIRKLGAALKGWTVEEGAAGGAPGTQPAYVVVTRLLFDSIDAFGKAFGPVAADIQGDIVNYTDAAPSIQMNDIKMAK
jgi:uncharacterized protein (TIGR02118 family)